MYFQIFFCNHNSRKPFFILRISRNKEGLSSHKILSAAAVVQGRKMLTRLIINSGFSNTMPRESCCLIDTAWLENGAGYLAPLEMLPRPPQGRALPHGGFKYMNVDATSFCLGEPLLTLQGWANTEGAVLTLPGNSRLRFCQKQKKQFSKEENHPLFHLPLGLLTTSLNHLEKPGSQGQKYQYNLQSLKREGYLPKCQGERAFQPLWELAIILAPRPFVMMSHFLLVPYNFSII